MLDAPRNTEKLTKTENHNFLLYLLQPQTDFSDAESLDMLDYLDMFTGPSLTP